MIAFDQQRRLGSIRHESVAERDSGVPGEMADQALRRRLQSRFLVASQAHAKCTVNGQPALSERDLRRFRHQIQGALLPAERRYTTHKKP